MSDQTPILRHALDDTLDAFAQAQAELKPTLKAQEVGYVHYVGSGIARVHGLPGVEAEEMLRFPGELRGMAFNLDPNEIGVILLGDGQALRSGDQVQRTHRTLDVPVGDNLLGRVVDPIGRPLDGQGPVHTTERWPVEREAPAIMDRAPVTIPLQTGIKSIDALIPVGRGQRELILGDRQTGKTSIALDTIINQHDKDMICVYCAIGQRSSAVAGFIDELKKRDALGYSVVVVAAGEAPPGVSFIAPYAATTIAEYFMEQGRDVLIVYDDLTRHAWSYRELSLLLRRPPGREAFPGDIFYIHSRLLERATQLRPELGGGSLTALPIIETEAQNVSAYIPTNIISITDGQIYLSPNLFQRGVLPAVDIGKSVSRVGGKTQLAAYRVVAGDLRLAYSQFEELENFARFGTRLDEATQKAIDRGRRVRETLKQPEFEPLPVAEQIVVLLTVTSGLFDELPVNQVEAASRAIREALVEKGGEIVGRIQDGDLLSEEDQEKLLDLARQAIKSIG
ncbi:MAG: alternate F1F0 ATPase, F1 subunit alpha [Chloroflexota bacterium]